MAYKDSFDNYRQTYSGGKKSNHTWAGRLDKLVKTIPDHVAFIRGDRQLTWREFGLRVNRLSNALLDMGVKKEDRVTVMGFNSIEWMESFFAIAKIGAVPVNLNPRFVPAEVKYLLEDADSVALIMEDDNLDRVTGIKDELPLLKNIIVIGDNVPDDMISYNSLMSKYPDSSPSFSWKITNEDFAFLFYTGGTTGYPKGTVWDNYNRVRGMDSLMVTALKPVLQGMPDMPDEALKAATDMMPWPVSESFVRSRLFRWAIERAAQNPSSEKINILAMGSSILYRLINEKMKLLTVAPLFHATAFQTNFSMLGAYGATTIFLEKHHPFDSAELWKTAEKHKVTNVVIVGDAFALPMVEELEKNNYDLSSLSMLVSSGVRFSPSVKKRFLKQKSSMILMDELGSTETSAAYSQVASANDDEIAQLKIKIQAEGLNVTRVIDPQTGKDVAPGEKGELIYGGFSSLGYWKDPEKTARTFKMIDGKLWFFVGDQGVLDQDGYFNFVGRGSSIINSGGEKVFAEEVEEILLAHPEIRDVGVTGLPDERWGEAVTAVIELGPDSDIVPEEIIEYCKNKMAGYKKPKTILVVEKLPRSASAKLERKELKKLAEKMADQ